MLQQHTEVMKKKNLSNPTVAEYQRTSIKTLKI